MATAKAAARSLLALVLIAGLANLACAQTRRLQQGFGNGIQAPQTIYIPSLGLSIAVGNAAGFYSGNILDTIFDEDGPLGGASWLGDYGFTSVIDQAVQNTVGLANEAATGSSTITVGK